MKLPLSWLREFAGVPDDAQVVADRFGRCGFAVDGLEGEVFDLDITANRPDCLSVYGLAREAATAFDVALADAPGAGAPAPAGHLAPIPVALEHDDCGRYALAVAAIMVGPSPAWLADRLTAAGIRPISNIVDVTNYVMLETGQPMHAFDAATLGGPAIIVRRARAGERLRTLDGQDRALDEGMLVIADASRPVALAGVMGGAATEVSAGTTTIALESAWFAPASVRETSRRLGLKTEASARFERGADPEAAARALRRAIELLASIGAIEDTSPIVDERRTLPGGRTVALAPARLERLLGDQVPAADVERILTALGFTPAPTSDGWTVAVPSHRVDVAREADLIEEVARHWGFDRVPATFPALTAMPRASSPGIARGRAIRRVLCAAGLQEAATFTFLEQAAAEPFAAAPLVRISNPLSEKFAVLRPSLAPGLLDAVAWSRRRESPNVAVFELGAVFSPAGETQRAGWLLTGVRESHWSAADQAVSFTDAKGIAELLATAGNVALDVRTADDVRWCTPGRRARIYVDGRVAGWLGELLPAVVEARGLSRQDSVVGGEMDLAVLAHAGATDLHPIAPLPRFPSAVRDLSVIVPDRLPAADVRGTIRAHAPATLVEVREFDRYQGKGVPDGRVSLSLRLTFRDASRTLTDAEVQQAVDAIVAALKHEHDAVLRGSGA